MIFVTFHKGESLEKQRKEVTVIIYFDENLFSFACKDIHGDNLVLELVDYDKCEIIGNIHDEAFEELPRKEKQ